MLMRFHLIVQFVFELFQSDNDATLRRAQILSDMHFRNLRSKSKLVQETEKVTKQLEVSFCSM